MLEENKQIILEQTGSNSVERIDVIQELWSGYGSIMRVFLSGYSSKSVIVKNIVEPVLSNHPRGWDTETSNARKLKSYEVETNWYRLFSNQCDAFCRVPNLIHFWGTNTGKFILMEDLNEAGFPLRKSSLRIEEIHACLKWLANFHASFMNKTSANLWELGTYWHLETRQDEFDKMEDGDLKKAAARIDQLLNECHYKTLVHGDAKVANFCFGNSPENIAAVDFQYVGGGCGMKDVAYFLGSVLGEEELEFLEEELLKEYFQFLREAIERKKLDIHVSDLESEWRQMYPLAWADFTRFLMGWMPTHQKLNRYSAKMVDLALSMI